MNVTRLLAAALVLTGTLCGAEPDLKNLLEARLFDADYAKMPQDGSGAAQFAKGKAAPQVLLEARPRFDVEAMEAINHGLLVGENCASLRYETAGNLNPQTGSLEILFENRLWDWNTKAKHLLFQCVGNGTVFYCYKHGLDGLGAYLGGEQPKWHCFPRQLPKKLSGRGLRHFLVTWSPKEVCFYLDGILIRETEAGAAVPQFAKYFSVGPSGKFGRENRTTICRVVSYNRALTPAEVRLLAKDRNPALNLAGVKDPVKIIMPSSRFLKNPGTPGIEALADDCVPPPWTPISRQGAACQVWNREYDFSGNTFLKQVISGKKKLLSGPIRLEIGTGSGVKSLELAPELKLEKSAAGRVVFTKAVTGPAPLTGRVRFTVEYDGMVLCEPELEQAAGIRSLVLRLPFAAEFAEAVHYVGTSRGTMLSIVAPDFSYSQSLPTTPGTVFQREFVTHLWLGNSYGGIQIFHESDRAFTDKERRDCFQIIRNADGSAVLETVYSRQGSPAAADGKLAFSFGLIATPVRPLPRHWRAWTLSAQYDGFTGETRGDLLIYWPDEWKEQISLDPDPERALDKEKTRAKIPVDRQNGHKVIPYWDHRHIGTRRGSVINPDKDYYLQHWGPEPQRRAGGGEREYVRVSTETGFTDFLLRCIVEWGRVFGPLDGVYIDEMEPVPNSRAEIGGGYADSAGSRHFTYPLLADRNLYKRMDAVVRSLNGGADPVSVAHCSGTLMLEILSHFPVFLVGEHLYSGYFPDRRELLPPENDRLYYYSYSLPMDRVRTEFYHRPYGAVMAFLPCLKNQRDIMYRPEPARDLLSRIMHADVLFWPLWCNAEEMAKVRKFRREYDIGNDAVEFIPWWENRAYGPQDRETCVSFYRKPGDDLVIVSNLARTPRTIVLTLPSGASGVRNAETGETVPVSAGKITLNIPRNDYRALRVKGAWER